MKRVLFLLTLLGPFLWLVGCGSTDVDKGTKSYRQAQKMYRKGHDNRQELVASGASVLQAFDKDVASVWEKGLEINPAHRPMRKDLARLYLQLGERYALRSEKFLENVRRLTDQDQRQVHLKKAEASRERSRYYLKEALKHFKSLRQRGGNLTSLDVYMGRTYFFLGRHDMALAHLKAAIESGELSPDREKEIQRSIRLIIRISSQRGD